MDIPLALDRDDAAGLQGQIRGQLAGAIADGRLPAGAALPSTRALARRLAVARNTVILAYQRLADEGYLEARPRRGYRVAAEAAVPGAAPAPGPAPRGAVAWPARWAIRPTALRHIVKPDWRGARFPFVYGQPDRALFPLAVWRECTRAALGRSAVEAWSVDEVGADDPELVRQIRARILPPRGVLATADEVLVTLGTQQALDLVARLLGGPRRVVVVEDPGYPDARHIFALSGARIRALPVDGEGLPVDSRLAGADLVYVTPSHQSPTTVTMPLARRRALLAAAERHDFVIVEDDYETEASWFEAPLPALKSIDRAGRVIHVGTLSKVLAPGLRLGFLVAAPEFVREARALRRLALRQPPANNQHTTALFVAGGHFDAMQRRLRRAWRERWTAMGAAIARHLAPLGCRAAVNRGGTSFWIEGPPGLDAAALARIAFAAGIVIEPGRVHFADEASAPRHAFRLGFSVIPAERIEPGVRALAALLRG